MERYALYRIQTKDREENLVAIETWTNETTQTDDKAVRIRFVKQPPYINPNTRYAWSLFIEHTDEGENIELTYDQKTHSCNVSADMLQPVTRKEIADFLHHAIFTNFGKRTNEKTDRSLRFEQMVLSEAVRTLYKTSES